MEIKNTLIDVNNFIEEPKKEETGSLTTKNNTKTVSILTSANARRCVRIALGITAIVVSALLVYKKYSDIIDFYSENYISKHSCDEKEHIAVEKIKRDSDISHCKFNLELAYPTKANYKNTFEKCKNEVSEIVKNNCLFTSKLKPESFIESFCQALNIVKNTYK